MLSLLVALLGLAVSPDRIQLSLDGPWEIATGELPGDGADWRAVNVPASFETALGVEFDGVATYRRSFEVPASFSGRRIVLQFDGAATHARVRVNGADVGEHLGGWTPFRVDITDQVKAGGVHELVVVVDERVGHNTQGFLPIIAPHFGGLWQSVHLLGLAESSLDDLGLLAVGDPQRGLALLEAPIVGPAEGLRVEVDIEIEGRTFAGTLPRGRGEIGVEGFDLWALGDPHLYPVRFRLVDEAGVVLDRVETSIAFRSLRTEGRTLLLNDKPLNVRGMLEWGYFPPSLDPAPSDEVIRREIADCRARGFNLIKCCLWIPPQRILRLFDEAGMLLWMEYPTWHPRFDGEHRADLVGEFEEFYAYDRNHPSVVLRSLTCETGPSASIEVIQDLYDRAKQRIPGALIVDDSSWIAWNRVFDFYDDHPYGNNNSWPDTLDALNEFIEAREAKPLILGEAIAADTWPDSPPGEELSIHAAGMADWARAVAERYGTDVVENLAPHSLRFAMNERKDQVEAYRLNVPAGGYVISVARDFNKAEMGLADHSNEPKWTVDQWSWHGDTMILPGRDTERAWLSGEAAEFPLFLAHHGPNSLPAGRLHWTFAGQQGDLDVSARSSGSVLPLGAVPLVIPQVEIPTEFVLHVSLGEHGPENHWSLWALPPVDPLPDSVHVTWALNPSGLQRLIDGESLILLADGSPGSLVLEHTWMLRGSLWFPPHPLAERLPPEFFLDLVVKELHPDGLLHVEGIADQISPLVEFWDTHDRTDVRDAVLVFETRVGKGRLLVSCLDHENAAGRHLLGTFGRHLESGPAPEVALSPETIDAILARLTGRTLDLTGETWQFQPEPGEGEDPGWVPIPIGRAWESFGYPTLDGWATYRIDLDLAEPWQGQPLYVNFEGVDDAFEVLFDGEIRGRGGDIESRATAFAEASSHLLTPSLTPGLHRLEVRVFDWYGAGGLHRPVRLSSHPFDPSGDFIAVD